MTDTTEKALVSWIESELGGKVESIERQARWRPAWLVDLIKEGEVLPLYVRGDRNEAFPEEPIEYEFNVLQALERAGIPVPHCYGICPDPHAIVMERVRGKFSLLQNVDSEVDRLSVLDHLAEIQAKFYHLDLAPLISAGMKMPSTRMQAISPAWADGERLYLKAKKRPDPRIEFMKAWIYRHAPDRPSKVTFLQGDPAQFMFEGGKITAMVDFELAALGDPILDLAGTRIRAVYEPMGDIRPLFRKYFELTGVKVDLQTLGFHTVAWMSVNLTHVTEALQSPKPDANVIEYISWYVNCFIVILETMAEVAGFEIEVPSPLPTVTPRWNMLYGRLEARLGLPEADGDDYPRRVDQNYLEFLRRQAMYGPGIESEYISEASAILQVSLNDWMEVDRALEVFVQTTGADSNEALIRMFHKWAYRQLELYKGLVSSMSIIDTPPMPLKELLAD